MDHLRGGLACGRRSHRLFLVFGASGGDRGVFIGDGVIMILSAAGVASLLQTQPVLFDIVKYAVLQGWLDNA